MLDITTMTNADLDSFISRVLPGIAPYEALMAERSRRIAAQHEQRVIVQYAEDCAWTSFEAGKFGYAVGQTDLDNLAGLLGYTPSADALTRLRAAIAVELKALLA